MSNSFPTGNVPSSLDPAGDAATQTAAAQQTSDAATQTAAPTATEAALETATAAAQQTATAAAQQTATAATQQTATAAAQQTAAAATQTAAAQQTATAAVQQTATEVARRATAVSAAQTYVAGIISARETATTIAQQTAAVQQTADAAGQQTATTIAGQTATAGAAAQQTATTIAGQTATAAAVQQAATAAAAQQAATAAAAQQTATAAVQQTATAAAAQQTGQTPPPSQRTTAPSGQGGSIPTQPNASPTASGVSVNSGNGSTGSGSGGGSTTSGQGGQGGTILITAGTQTPAPPGPSFDLSNLPPPTAQSMDVTISGQKSTNATPAPTTASKPDPRRSSPPVVTPSVGASARQTSGSATTRAQTHTADRALRVVATASLLQPGGVQRLVVSYVERSVVQAHVELPGTSPVSIIDVTDDYGRLTMDVPIPAHVALQRGHARGRIVVDAVTGPWQPLASLTPTVHPGTSEHIAVTFAPHTYVRAIVTFPGQRPLTLYNVTDDHGHVAVSFAVPKTRALLAAHNVATLVVSALTDKRHAEVVQPVRISDMVVNIVPGRIVNCVQPTAIEVGYYPSTPLRVVLTFPHNYRVPLHVHTDRYGHIRLEANVTYARAHNPVQITASVSDARVGHSRVEGSMATIALPVGCRG